MEGSWFWIRFKLTSQRFVFHPGNAALPTKEKGAGASFLTWRPIYRDVVVGRFVVFFFGIEGGVACCSHSFFFFLRGGDFFYFFHKKTQGRIQSFTLWEGRSLGWKAGILGDIFTYKISNFGTSRWSGGFFFNQKGIVKLDMFCWWSFTFY